MMSRALLAACVCACVCAQGDVIGQRFEPRPAVVAVQTETFEARVTCIAYDDVGDILYVIMNAWGQRDSCTVLRVDGTTYEVLSRSYEVLPSGYADVKYCVYRSGWLHFFPGNGIAIARALVGEGRPSNGSYLDVRAFGGGGPYGPELLTPFVTDNIEAEIAWYTATTGAAFDPSGIAYMIVSFVYELRANPIVFMIDLDTFAVVGNFTVDVANWTLSAPVLDPVDQWLYTAVYANDAIPSSCEVGIVKIDLLPQYLGDVAGGRYIGSAAFCPALIWRNGIVAAFLYRPSPTATPEIVWVNAHLPIIMRISTSSLSILTQAEVRIFGYSSIVAGAAILDAFTRAVVVALRFPFGFIRLSLVDMQFTWISASAPQLDNLGLSAFLHDASSSAITASGLTQSRNAMFVSSLRDTRMRQQDAFLDPGASSLRRGISTRYGVLVEAVFPSCTFLHVDATTMTTRRMLVWPACDDRYENTLVSPLFAWDGGVFCMLQYRRVDLNPVATYARYDLATGTPTLVPTPAWGNVSHLLSVVDHSDSTGLVYITMRLHNTSSTLVVLRAADGSILRQRMFDRSGGGILVFDAVGDVIYGFLQDSFQPNRVVLIDAASPDMPITVIANVTQLDPNQECCLGIASCCLHRFLGKVVCGHANFAVVTSVDLDTGTVRTSFSNIFLSYPAGPVCTDDTFAYLVGNVGEDLQLQQIGLTDDSYDFLQEVRERALGLLPGVPQAVITLSRQDVIVVTEGALVRYPLRPPLPTLRSVSSETSAVLADGVCARLLRSSAYDLRLVSCTVFAPVLRLHGDFFGVFVNESDFAATVTPLKSLTLWPNGSWTGTPNPPQQFTCNTTCPVGDLCLCNLTALAVQRVQSAMSDSVPGSIVTAIEVDVQVALRGVGTAAGYFRAILFPLHTAILDVVPRVVSENPARIALELVRNASLPPVAELSVELSYGSESFPCFGLTVDSTGTIVECTPPPPSALLLAREFDVLLLWRSQAFLRFPRAITYAWPIFAAISPLILPLSGGVITFRAGALMQQLPQPLRAWLSDVPCTGAQLTIAQLGVGQCQAPSAMPGAGLQLIVEVNGTMNITSSPQVGLTVSSYLSGTTYVPLLSTSLSFSSLATLQWTQSEYLGTDVSQLATINVTIVSRELVDKLDLVSCSVHRTDVPASARCTGGVNGSTYVFACALSTPILTSNRGAAPSSSVSDLQLVCTGVGASPYISPLPPLSLRWPAQLMTVFPSAAAPGAVVTLRGSELHLFDSMFSSTPQVLIGNTTCSDVVIVSTDEIRCTVPPASAGSTEFTASVVVIDVRGRSNELQFQYPPAAELRLVSLSADAANSVAILPHERANTVFSVEMTLAASTSSASATDVLCTASLCGADSQPNACRLVAQDNASMAVATQNASMTLLRGNVAALWPRGADLADATFVLASCVLRAWGDAPTGEVRASLVPAFVSMSWQRPPPAQIPSQIVFNPPPSVVIATTASVDDSRILPYLACTLDAQGLNGSDTGAIVIRSSVRAPTSRIVELPRFAISGRRLSSFIVIARCELDTLSMQSFPIASLTAPTSIEGCDTGSEPGGSTGWLCNECPTNFFSDGGSTPCVPCPSRGASCVRGVLALLPGFYRADVPLTGDVSRRYVRSSVVINVSVAGDVGPWMELHPCWNSEACAVNATRRSYACTPGYKGPLCGVCDESLGLAMVGTVCRACWPAAASWLLIITGCALGCVGLLWLVFWRKPTASSPSMIALRTFVSYIQTLSALSMFRVASVKVLRSLMVWTDVLAMFPFSHGGLRCVLRWSTLTSFAVAATSPLLLLAALALAIACGALYVALRDRWSRATGAPRAREPASSTLAVHNPLHASVPVSRPPSVDALPVLQPAVSLAAAVRQQVRAVLERRQHVSSALYLLALMYMPVMTECLRVLDCYGPVSAVFYLRVDVSVQCYGTAHTAALTLAWIVLLLYGAGYPLYILWSLGWCIRDRSYFVAQVEDFQATWRSLYDGYSPARDMLWWEGVVMLRKATLAGIAYLLADSIAGVAAAVLVLAVALYLQDTFSPYDDAFMNDLERGFLAAALLTAGSSLLFTSTSASQAADASRGDQAITIIVILANCIPIWYLLVHLVRVLMPAVLASRLGRRALRVHWLRSALLILFHTSMYWQELEDIVVAAKREAKRRHASSAGFEVVSPVRGHAGAVHVHTLAHAHVGEETDKPRSIADAAGASANLERE